jgi:hypothetical protein
LLDRSDDLQSVLTVPHDHDATDGLASSVAFGHAEAQVRTDGDFRNVADPDGRPDLPHADPLPNATFSSSDRCSGSRRPAK